MRKRLMVLLLFAMMGIIPRLSASIIVVNNMPCDVYVQFFAHDANYPTLCSLYKATRVLVPGNGGFVNYANVAAANPDWWIPPVPPIPPGMAQNIPSAGAAPSQFDAVIVDYQSTFGGMVGNTAGCATTVSLSGSGGSGACASTCNILWTQIGSAIFVTIDP